MKLRIGALAVVLGVFVFYAVSSLDVPATFTYDGTVFRAIDIKKGYGVYTPGGAPLSTERPYLMFLSIELAADPAGTREYQANFASKMGASLVAEGRFSGRMKDHVSHMRAVVTRGKLVMVALLAVPGTRPDADRPSERIFAALENLARDPPSLSRRIEGWLL